jgi:hypothetical protein
MLANPDFLKTDPRFWAYVRLLSQSIGYTDRKTSTIRVYNVEEVRHSLQTMGLAADLINATPLGNDLIRYFQYRAEILNEYVRPHLMTVSQASDLFASLGQQLQPTCPLPMNKQTGQKKTYAYLTGMVNMLVEAHAQGWPCDYAPRSLTIVTEDRHPIQVLARQMDGCFTSAINPIAVWEIKEYYYTTTFGSRIADAVYETLLDGMELADLYTRTGVKIQHLLIIDAYETWWVMGKSYLCRLIDTLHMGYVDEILFGREVIERLPESVQQWVAIATARSV